jgi:hypothetical protein
MSKPLVLYYAGPDRKLAIDALAGAEQYREWWAGAELVAVESIPWARKLDGRRAYMLGLNPKGRHRFGDDVIQVDPTPDASIAMQVWRRLHIGLECERCAHGPRDTCEERCTPTIVTNDDAPTWLRYLDDAVCERWALPDSRAVWAWVETFGLEALSGAWREYQADHMHPSLVHAGRAILREREQWEEEREDYFRALVDHEHTAARLRVERNQFKSAAENGGALVAELLTERDDLARAVLDAEGRAAELRAGLIRALEWWEAASVEASGDGPGSSEYVTAGGEAEAETWAALCERAGVKRG